MGKSHMKQNAIGILQILIIFGCIMAIIGLTRSVIELRGRSNMAEERQSELDKVKKENAELKKRYEEVQTPEFVEREIRERLGLVKEGETLVLVDKNRSPQSEQPVSNFDPQLPNWKQWMKLFF